METESLLGRVQEGAQERQICQIEKKIVQALQCDDVIVNDIRIIPESSEKIHTLFIKGTQNTDRNIYLGHGFGGSSLMYFPAFEHLRKKGNLILWEIRGMGLNNKPQSYQIPDADINRFFVHGFQTVLDFYNHKNVFLVNHSLSAYVVFRYLLEQRNENIQKIIMLSPIGITPKHDDAKDRIRGLGDVWQTLLARFGWKFNLTYKSPMRTVMSCFKHRLLRNAFNEYEMPPLHLSLMVQLFLRMVSLNDGSENLFFRQFLPRVLPKKGQSIVELLREKPSQSKCLEWPISLYFGDRDWADRKGAIVLSQQLQNTKVTILQNTDHMIPINSESMRKIIDAEFPN